ncbi:hypothetical protein NLO85_27395, partial [Pseudomonas savastanoi]
QHFHADHPVFSCSKSEQKQLNTWVSFQSAEQPLLGQFSVSGNSASNGALVNAPFLRCRTDTKCHTASSQAQCVIALLRQLTQSIVILIHCTSKRIITL